MTHLLLTSSGEWGEMFLTIFGLFGFIFLVAILYSKIADKTKGDEETKNCLWPFVLAISIAALFGIKNCKGCEGSSNGGGGGGYWDNTPRHTQIQKPTQNNVNSYTFHTFAI